ncbi:hypothetical protein QO002_001968 [Pararhizobium capsulatum DSM 1112]|uniref:Transmembrane protein n=1 Tax=Pararhizobium capsulatum DSM 1112 TaxID=1121113 RepID=A0ABU0BNJ3_9HYPH|nr:hypothetical protein [Pararhizobium capsulatum]MDQ0319830.1 hypothetical protein [Pararhizobium capsulatum DSM 1112]
MMPMRTLRSMLASAAFVGLAAAPAFALDGADLVAKFNAASAANGTTITYDGADVDGDTLTLSNVILKTAAGPGRDLKIGEVTLEGIEEYEDGSYYVETVSLPDVNVSETEGSVSVKDIALGGLSIPANPAGGTIDDILLYESASTGPVSVTAKGKQVFALEGVDANLTRQESDTGFDFDATLKGLKADLSDVEDAKAKDAIQKLGLTNLAGEITMKGSWEIASGNISLGEFALDFANVGRLALAFDISGYTLEFMKSVQEAMKAQEANPNKEEANQALGLSMMGLMQQLTFNGASIRFDDASITKRVLDYLGKEQGVSGDQLAQSLKGLIPVMMAQLNVPELQNQVSAAANTYLDQPKSLTITAKPDKPVPFPMIVGAAMGAPNTMPSVLGVKVTAND